MNTNNCSKEHYTKDKPQFVATITYQIKGKIRLDGRTKTSPKFDTLYGLIYWLNKQPYSLEYSIFRTDKLLALREGIKKMGDFIK